MDISFLIQPGPTELGKDISVLFSLGQLSWEQIYPFPFRLGQLSWERIYPFLSGWPNSVGERIYPRLILLPPTQLGKIIFRDPNSVGNILLNALSKQEQVNPLYVLDDLRISKEAFDLLVLATENI